MRRSLAWLCAGVMACTSGSDGSSSENAGTGGASVGAPIDGSGGASAPTGGTGGTPPTPIDMGNVPVGGAGGAPSLPGTGGDGTSGAPADAGPPDSGGGTEECTGEGATEHFSFFVTSLEGLRRLANDPNGFGGDLRFGKTDGLSGADEICRQLAEASFPGAGCKTWRAFLSATRDASGNPVHARDRIGEGPWYDRLGRIVAMNKTDLLQAWPQGADPVIQYDLPNEFGVPNHDPDGTGQVDNHTTITGSGPNGMLAGMDPALTCQDWTSREGTAGKPRIGFSWRGGAGMVMGSMWYTSMFAEAGCAARINLDPRIMDLSTLGIGAQGGYGGFYCLALEP